MKTEIYCPICKGIVNPDNVNHDHGRRTIKLVKRHGKNVPIIAQKELPKS